jgi:hypothetical protein
MTPAEVRALAVADYLAMLELMDRDMKERQKQQRRAGKKR